MEIYKFNLNFESCNENDYLLFLVDTYLHKSHQNAVDKYFSDRFYMKTYHLEIFEDEKFLSAFPNPTEGTVMKEEIFEQSIIECLKVFPNYTALIFHYLDSDTSTVVTSLFIRGSKKEYILTSKLIEVDPLNGPFFHDSELLIADIKKDIDEVFFKEVFKYNSNQKRIKLDLAPNYLWYGGKYVIN